MKEKDLSEIDRKRIRIYKKYFMDWFQKYSPKLSLNSVKLYTRSLSLVAITLLPSKQMTITDKIMLDILRDTYDASLKDVPNVEIDENENNVNSILNAVAKFIRVSGDMMDVGDKLELMEEHLKARSVEIRESIIETKSRNHKNDNEEAHMRPFMEYVKVANDLYDEYKTSLKKSKEHDDFEEGIKTYLPKLKFRNIILISMILLNKTKVDGMPLYSILRLVEYTSLLLWNKKEKPPKNKKNYVSIPDRVIYIQLNKTTGHDNQLTLKKFKIFNKKIIDMIEIYSKVYKIENGEPLFTSHWKNGKSNAINKTALSKLLNIIFKDISPHTTIGLIRKAYDSQKLTMTGLQYKKSASMNDHSIETVETYYKKI